MAHCTAFPFQGKLSKWEFPILTCGDDKIKGEALLDGRLDVVEREWEAGDNAQLVDHLVELADLPS